MKCLLSLLRILGPTKPRNKKSQSATSKMTTKTAGGESSMMRRVLSANKHKVSRLANIMEELQQEVEELKLENRSLKRVSHRQEREIRKIDEEEAALPVLLQRHSAEMRTLKERLKKNQEVLHRKEKESQDRDHEIQKLRDKVKSYRELSQEKKLGERAALAKKLENVESEVALKDKKIMVSNADVKLIKDVVSSSCLYEDVMQILWNFSFSHLSPYYYINNCMLIGLEIHVWFMRVKSMEMIGCNLFFSVSHA